MQNVGDLLSMPPMYRDIGTSFLAQNMSMPVCGAPYVGATPYAGAVPGTVQMRPSLTSDKFETIQREKVEQKKDVKKTVGVLTGLAAGILGLFLFRKKIPAVNNLFTKAATAIKGFCTTTLPKVWQSVKGFFTGLFKKAPKALPPHVA